MTIEVRDAHGSVMDVKSPSRLPASIRPLEIGPEAARRTTGFNNNAVGLTTGGRTEWPLKLGPIRQDWGGAANAVIQLRSQLWGCRGELGSN
jgi:hypothetical protein